jgi:hypothetical protein
MLAVTCPSARNRTGLTLVPVTRVVGMTDDGAGTITVTVACYDGHLHEIVTGRAVTDATATPVAVLPAPAERAAARLGMAS